MAELEAEIEDRRGRVGALRNQMVEVPPAPTEVAVLLDRLPLLADRLAGLPQRELRALFDALQLKLVYQPADLAIDVDLTLAAVDGGEAPATESAEVWSVPPAGLEPAHPAPEAGALSTELRGPAASVAMALRPPCARLLTAGGALLLSAQRWPAMQPQSSWSSMTTR